MPAEDSPGQPLAACVRVDLGAVAGRRPWAPMAEGSRKTSPNPHLVVEDAGPSKGLALMPGPYCPPPQATPRGRSPYDCRPWRASAGAWAEETLTVQVGKVTAASKALTT